MHDKVSIEYFMNRLSAFLKADHSSDALVCIGDIHDAINAIHTNIRHEHRGHQIIYTIVDTDVDLNNSSINHKISAHKDAAYHCGIDATYADFMAKRWNIEQEYNEFLVEYNNKLAELEKQNIPFRFDLSIDK